MSNMSYCRFRNTLGDLQDCYENWDDNELDPENSDNDSAEVRARAKLLKLCKDIVSDFGDDDSD